MNNPKLAEAFARRYMALNEATDKEQSKNWFNQDGSFNYENFKKQIPTNNGKLFVWSDGLNGIGHDVYAGRVYGIATGNGRVKYYNHIPEGWQVTGDKIKFDDITNLYMLIPKSEEQQVEDQAEKKIPSKENIKNLKEQENTEITDGEAEKIQLSEIKDEEIDSLYINMDFLGLNLAQVPTKSSDWKAYIIPILYVIVAVISLRITNSTKPREKQKTEEKSSN